MDPILYILYGWTGLETLRLYSTYENYLMCNKHDNFYKFLQFLSNVNVYRVVDYLSNRHRHETSLLLSSGPMFLSVLGH